MHDFDSPLPTDLAAPRRDADDARMWAGIIVGGVLMLITAGLLVVAIVVG